MLNKGLTSYFEYLQRHWKIIAVFVLGLTPLLWLRPGFIVARGDLFPFIEPSLNFPRYVYVWSDPSGLGSVSQAGGYSPAQTIWMSISFLLSEIGLSIGFIQILLEVFYFLGAGLSMYFLATTLYKKEKITPFIASLFYMFNFLMMLRTFNASASWVLVFLPLTLAFYVRIIDNVKNGQKTLSNILAFSAISAVLMSFATVNPAFLVEVVIVFMTAFSYSIITQKGFRTRLVKALGVLFVTCFFFNTWWIIPFSSEIFTYVIGSLQLGTTTNVVSLSFVYSRSSFLNLFWLNGIWNWMPEYFNFTGYYSNSVLSLLVFVPMIVAFAGFLFKSKYGKINLFFAGAILILMFLSKGLHPPFENVNLFLYNHVPGFFLFREPFIKFYIILVIPLALLIGSSCNTIVGHLKNSRIRCKTIVYRLFLIFMICTFLISVFPMLNGQIIPSSTRVKIPDYWYQVSNYLNNVKGDFRVLLTPGDDYYQMNYSWGYYGTDALAPSLITKPIIYQVSGGYATNPEVISLVYQKIEENQTSGFLNLLALLNVQYILQRNDIVWNSSGRTIVSPDQIKSFLSNQSGITLQASFGNLDLYKVSSDNFLPKIYSAADAVLIIGSINEMSWALSSNDSTIGNNVFFLSDQISKEQGQFIGNLSNTNFVNEKTIPILTFQGVNPTKYEITVENATAPFFIVFSESYDPQWKAYVSNNVADLNRVVASYPNVNVKEADDGITFAPQDISYLFSSSISEQYHFMVNGYANAWYINPQQFNNETNFTITLYYLPQSYDYLGLSVTGITLAICAGYLLYELKQRNLQIKKRLRLLTHNP
jgi:arabinofuranan 3-O-arabinosyltransferase